MTPNDDRLAAFEARFDARLAELEERDRKRETDVLSALTQLKSMSENAATEEHRRDEDYTLLTQSLDQRLTEFASVGNAQGPVTVAFLTEAFRAFAKDVGWFIHREVERQRNLRRSPAE